jgi:hypothetical protein
MRAVAHPAAIIQAVAVTSAKNRMTHNVPADPPAA